MDEQRHFQPPGAADNAERLRDEAKRCRERSVYAFHESTRSMLWAMAETHEREADRLEAIEARKTREQAKLIAALLSQKPAATIALRA